MSDVNLPAAGKWTDCELEGIGFAENEETGTPYIYTEWNHPDLMYPVTVFTYLSDASFEKGMQKLESIGFNGDFDDPDCEVRTVDLICRHETWEGKVRAKFEFANWGGGISHHEASSNTKKLLSKKWQKEHRTAPKSSGGSGSGKGGDSKPSASKKSAPAAPPVKSSQTPREKAWSAFAEARSDWEQSALVDAWDVLLDECFPEKPESEYTAEDWARVEVNSAF